MWNFSRPLSTNKRVYHSYKVVSDYEKLKSNGQYEHFLLIINKDHNLIEVPVRSNIKVNYIA